METERIKIKECPYCHGSGVINVTAEGGTIYCSCPAGEDAREYDKETKKL